MAFSFLKFTGCCPCTGVKTSKAWHGLGPTTLPISVHTASLILMVPVGSSHEGLSFIAHTYLASSNSEVSVHAPPSAQKLFPREAILDPYKTEQPPCFHHRDTYSAPHAFPSQYFMTFAFMNLFM